ncbi:PLP-dependent aminotransferase family protein [Streptomyces sp. NPDC005408]|uniref:MocR-like pyridoxine biosynthesis transcription factor PdxR n=1 Tax=Streptomyces sp. NPDC005408 TaxID=3155341 RepID=UPI00339FD50B
MPIEWAGSGPGLLLSLDRQGPEPLRSQLEGLLREAIRTGRLGVGERLPSSREMARELGLSRGLVQECYGQLQAEGYLSTQVGSATRVAAGAGISPAAPAPRPRPARLIADFASGVPDLAGFPRGDWLWALREASRTAPTAAFDYGDPHGSSLLREVLAAYLGRVRAAAADPERTVICSGFAQGLNLVLRALADGGVRKVAFEDPGYTETAAAACAAADVETVPVPVDAYGIDVDALEATGARAVVLTPAHQWPTGVVLAPERRLALVRWATRHDATIVEDDYDAEFRYDREPVGALQGLAADRVAAIGTVSKSLAPAMRLGWILCPPALADTVAELKLRQDRGSPELDQLALAALMESGRYDRHLRRMRVLYAQRRTALVESLAEHAPEVRLTGLAAGFHAVAHLPEGADEQSVIAAARERSVGLYGMSTHRSSGATDPAQLVLGFGNLGERPIREGIAAVAGILRGEREAAPAPE